MATNHRRTRLLLFILTLIAVGTMALCSCGEEGEPIDQPDEFTHVYRAGEKVILRAIHQTFKDKDLGKASIHADTHEVTSDYIIQGEWRIRGLARLRELDRNEMEVTLSIYTEKKTPAGWELRRLLKKEQYDRFFFAIDTQIYREMAKPD